MADIARLNVLIEAKAEGLEKALKTATDDVAKFGSRMRSVGTALTVGITLPVVAIGTAATKAAAEAEESENLFSVSMGRMAGAARAFSEQVSDSLGANAFAIRETIGRFQSLFTTLGLGERAAFDMSKQLTTLTLDLSSFFNVNTQTAFERLQSGLAGETEALRRFNIFVDEATLKQIAYRNGIAKTGAELTAAEKVQARYLAIVQQTAIVQGDLARTLDSPTNQFRILKERVKELTIELGRELLPTIKSLLQTGNRLVDFVERLIDRYKDASPTTQRFVRRLIAVGAVTPPVIAVLGSLIEKLALAKIAFGSTGTTLGVKFVTALAKLQPLLAPAGAILVGLGAAGASLVFVRKALLEAGAGARQFARDFNASISETRQLAADASADQIQSLIDTRQIELNALVAQAAEINNRIGQLESAGADRLASSQRGQLERVRGQIGALQSLIDSLREDLGSVLGEGAVGATVTGTNQLSAALKELEASLASARRQADIFGLGPLEDAEERLSIVQGAIRGLLDEGLEPPVSLIQRYRTLASEVSNLRDQLERITEIDSERLQGILAPQGLTLAQSALRGISAGALDDLDGPGDRIERALLRAEDIANSFKGAFRQVGSGLVSAIAEGAISAQAILGNAFLGIIGGVVGSITSAIGGKIATGLFPGLFSQAPTSTAAATSVAPASFTVAFPDSIRAEFRDPAGAARSAGGQTFVREALVVAREGGAG